MIISQRHGHSPSGAINEAEVAEPIEEFNRRKHQCCDELLRDFSRFRPLIDV